MPKERRLPLDPDRMNKTRVSNWTTWPNFDDFGEEDGLTIIGTNDTPLFCSVRGATAADIALAAAAPELLEALEIAERILIDCADRDELCTEDVAELRNIRAAIAKAKGETHA